MELTSIPTISYYSNLYYFRIIYLKTVLLGTLVGLGNQQNRRSEIPDCQAGAAEDSSLQEHDTASFREYSQTFRSIVVPSSSGLIYL
jgi:hypothetical protein